MSRFTNLKVTIFCNIRRKNKFAEFVRAYQSAEGDKHELPVPVAAHRVGSVRESDRGDPESAELRQSRQTRSQLQQVNFLFDFEKSVDFFTKIYRRCMNCPGNVVYLFTKSDLLTKFFLFVRCSTFQNPQNQRPRDVDQADALVPCPQQNLSD